MILAELELHHSRPVAPTRRLALGMRRLPSSPAPGFGGILLGGIVAAYARDIDPDLEADYQLLLRRLRDGRPVHQPQIRHRLQRDRVGLIHTRHQLVGDGERMRFVLDRGQASPIQHLLAAAYAAGEMDASARLGVIDAITTAMGWRGEIDERLIAHLTGRRGRAGWSLGAMDDPVAWARDVLVLDGAGMPTRRDVQRAFRDRLRDAHPDHGAADDGAAQRIADLTEARRILLG